MQSNSAILLGSAIFAGIAVVAGVSYTSWLVLKPRYDVTAEEVDIFTDCLDGSVAGGTAAIGGPFELTTHEGVRVTDVDVIDKPSLIYFGYTFCPDICPMDSARNGDAVDLLTERGLDVKPVFITIDPARDDVETVADFVDWIHEDMVGLTGSAEEIAAVTLAYRAYSAKNGTGEDYLMDHSTFSYLVLPEHGFVEYFRNSETPEQMADRIGCFVEKAGAESAA